MSDLYRYCKTDRQKEIVRLYESGLNKTEVGRELGITRETVKGTIKIIEDRAAKQGYSPDHDMVHQVPDGFQVSGVSTYYDSDGRPTGQWVKSKQDAERRIEMMIERIEQACDNVEPFEPTPRPQANDQNLCSVLTITDYHLGMKASQESEGGNWDAKIARDTFLNAIHDMIEASPNSKTGILAQLGDWLHWDGILPVTPQSKHVLIGTDDRYAKLVDITIQVMDEAVKMMLEHFEEIVIVQAEGNHDISSSVWIRKYLKHRWSAEPRVEVIDNDWPFYAYLHGKTLIGWHHGHRMKMAQLQKLFCSEPRIRPLWGQSDFAYLHTGHLHHERVLEDSGCTIEQHPTLSARDHYAVSHGYTSARGAKVITYDAQDGEVHRVTVRPRL